MITARIFGVYAAILAFIHGIFEIQQGNILVESISINAVGNGCVSDQIWHACFPAMTLWPTYLSAGLVAISISSLFFLFILFFLKKSYSAWIMIAFAIANLLSGGGFIPTFTIIMAAVAVLINKKPLQNLENKQKPYNIVWSIFLSIYLLYAAGGWLFGSFLNTFMIENSFLLFFTMDLLIPIFCIVFARMAGIRTSA